MFCIIYNPIMVKKIPFGVIPVSKIYYLEDGEISNFML
jgi:hypothetical protein